VNDGFRIWDANDSADRALWVEAWSAGPGREVFNHPDYLKLFAEAVDRPLCAYLQSDEGTVMYPFILRPVDSEGPARSGDLTDMITPYGYGGPQAWAASSISRLAAEFWPALDSWAATQNVVTEFVRFGLFRDAYLPYVGDARTRAINVVVALGDAADAMWMSFDQKVRKNVKKAQRSGITMSIDETGQFLDDFLRIYVGTMDRREAAAGYFFPRSFFETIIKQLPGQFAFFHASLDDRIVSTELVLVSEDSVYSFLGGTDSAAFEFRPNDLLKFEVITWAAARGKKHFVLGGGASPGDGIERYKRAFAPNGSVDFVTGQRVLHPDAYEALVAAKRADVEARDMTWPDDLSYFPAYRITL
jgi:hypothetical protein